MKTQINGKESPWSVTIINLWNKKVKPIFTEGETCSMANYFTPRPYRNEYDRGSNKAGFTYIVMPGYRVCVLDWTEEKNA